LGELLTGGQTSNVD